MLEKIEERLDTEAVIEEFESITIDADRVQRETLEKILQENGETEYLLKCGLDRKTDPVSFKAHVPIVTHEYLEPYIHRIADGENSSILTTKPITTISLSSGTTQGKQKYVPFNDELIDNTMQIYKTSFAFRNREYPIGNGKALQFIYSSKQFKTKGGLTAGTATTNVYRNKEFKKTMAAMQTPCCSPDEVIFANSFDQSLYCHLLCGLIFSDEIQVVSSTFAHSIVHSFRTFEKIWPQLVADIHDGTLSDGISSLSIRSAILEKVLVEPNPGLADKIYDKCLGLSNCNWYGLIPEIFPNAKYVYGIMTGSMEGYLKKLRHYAGGDLALVCADYGASEGWIGVNVNPRLSPEMATFAVVPNIGYFEFLEMGLLDLCDDHEPVGLTEVEVGKEYEIIITTFAGLYRYRLGDVVKVKGFHNSTPELQFICRSNLLLNINIDKTTEKDLQLSVNAAANLLAGEKFEVVDFTSFADRSTDPGNYVIFWEINGTNNNNNDDASDDILKECCNCLDRSFVDAGYVSSRKVNAIGALELRIVKRGTFNKIMDHYVGLGAAVSQFKTPRCVGTKNGKVLEILCGNVVKSYFSTAFN